MKTDNIKKEAENMELINKAKKGDLLSFEKLIIEHEKIVYNVALRMMSDKDDAYDMSQEAFIKAFRNIGNFNEQSTFSTWIYRITVNTCIDEMRKRKNKNTISIDEKLEGDENSFQKEIRDTGETPEDIILRKEKDKEIIEALDNLSEEHKIVIVLREIQGFSYEEIAESTDLSLGTVKSRISRARNQLKLEILKIWERNKK